MDREEFIVECACGFDVRGFSKIHAEKNLEQHILSKNHKNLIKFKKKWLNEKNNQM